jgi:hypothetical protein
MAFGMRAWILGFIFVSLPFEFFTRRTCNGLLEVGTCYFAPNICSSLPSWLDRQRATPFLTSCFTADRSACEALDAALAAFAGVMGEEG